MGKSVSQRLISKTLPQKVLDRNAEALKSYDSYKKTSTLMERVDIALGRKPTFKTDTHSTLDSAINQHGIGSTTA